MASRFCVTAPGKIILHGEHSVVYGKKAIACAIGSRVVVDATISPGISSMLTVEMPAVDLPELEINCADLEIEATEDKNYDDIVCILEKKCCKIFGGHPVSNFTRIAISCILYAYCKTKGQKKTNDRTASVISMKIKSEIPIGAGLGSSAAFNTSVACTFLLLSKSIHLPEGCENFASISKEKDLKAINALAYEMESIVHKTPSGIDNCIATYGGAVAFQSGLIKHLDKMPTLQLLIVNSKVPRSTKTLVSKVREYVSSYPSIVTPILDSMDAISCAAESLLQNLNGNNYNTNILSTWGRLIETNQSLLASLGVSHSSLDKICSIASKFRCPAKLTGAGGGGCAIIFLDIIKNDHEAISHLEEELVLEGYECIKASLGGKGLLVKAFLQTN